MKKKKNKINTWEIANKIDKSFDWRKGDPCLEEANFDYDVANEKDEDVDDAELEFYIKGNIEHPMSGWLDSYNTAIDIDGDGKITKDGKIHIKGTYKMEVGTATYIDELDELRKIKSTAKVGEEQSFEWTSDNTEDFIEGLKEIPQ